MKKNSLWAFLFGGVVISGCGNSGAGNAAGPDSAQTKSGTAQNAAAGQPAKQQLDTARYDQLMNYLANGDTSGRWPVKNSPYPLPGAILPFNRVVAYYGNLYSNRMGALGKWPKKEMIPKLLDEVKNGAMPIRLLSPFPACTILPPRLKGRPAKTASTATVCLTTRLIQS